MPLSNKEDPLEPSKTPGLSAGYFWDMKSLAHTYIFTHIYAYEPKSVIFRQNQQIEEVTPFKFAYIQFFGKQYCIKEVATNRIEKSILVFEILTLTFLDRFCDYLFLQLHSLIQD